MASAFSPERERVPVDIMKAEEEKLSAKSASPETKKTEQMESTVAFNIDRDVDELMALLPANRKPEFDQARADRGEKQESYYFESERFDTPEGQVRMTFEFIPAGKEAAGTTSLQFKGPQGVGNFRIERNRITQCAARFGAEDLDNYPLPLTARGDKVDDRTQRAATAGKLWNQAKPFVEQKIRSEAAEYSQAA